MSRDGKYILSYEAQAYTEPTPMELDKRVITNQYPGTEFVELDRGLTVHAELPKYTLTREQIYRLKADAVFESIDGSPYRRVDDE